MTTYALYDVKMSMNAWPTEYFYVKVNLILKR